MSELNEVKAPTKAEITITTAEDSVIVSIVSTLVDIITKGAKISLSKAAKDELVSSIQNILATLDAINNLDYRDEALEVGGVTHAISKYQICSCFEGLLTPRKVAVSSDARALDLSKSVTFGTNIGEVLSPVEFREAQFIVMCSVKKEIGNTVTADSKSFMLITEAPAVSNGTYVTNKAGNRSIPVFLSTPLYKDSYYTEELVDYLKEYLMDIRDAMRK